MPFSRESIAYALTFSTGGCIRILVKWLNEDERKSPDEMASIMKDIVLISNYPNITEKKEKGLGLNYRVP